jgi:hypothetical protein
MYLFTIINDAPNKNSTFHLEIPTTTSWEKHIFQKLNLMFFLESNKSLKWHSNEQLPKHREKPTSLELPSKYGCHGALEGRGRQCLPPHLTPPLKELSSPDQSCLRSKPSCQEPRCLPMAAEWSAGRYHMLYKSHFNSSRWQIPLNILLMILGRPARESCLSSLASPHLFSLPLLGGGENIPKYFSWWLSIRG